jgi:flagellum-specific peptidoglycan hydrolase FlgJ
MSVYVGSRKDFVKKYGRKIRRMTAGTGIFPGTLITQLILESSGNFNGKWQVGGSKLSREANNYFGIKCGSSWKGAKYNISTREETATGQSYYTNACFRKYNNIEQSIKDYIRFLKQNKRYQNAGVFNAPNVIEQFKALKRAGYATASNYVDTLSQIYYSLKIDIDEATKRPIFKASVILPLALVGGATYYILNKE